MAYDAKAEALRLGNSVCSLEHERHWTICPDCAERFLAAAHEAGRAEMRQALSESPPSTGTTCRATH